MTPSSKWFPTNLQDRAAWFQNFVTQFTPLATMLGFSASEVADITNDNADFQSIAATTVELEAFASAVRQFRITLTEGDIGDPQPQFPAENFSPPPNARPAGMFERIDDYVKRIRTAAAYTPEIGAALGIIPSPPPPPGPVQPDLKVTTSTGFKIAVAGSMKSMDAIRVEYQRNGASGWSLAAFLTKMPGEFTITPATTGEPEAGRIRAIFIKKNAETGSFSPEYPVTVS